MIRFRYKGDFHNTERFFAQATKATPEAILRKYGEAGVTALSSATPIRTGMTASSWEYEIVTDADGYTIYWNNTNIQNGENIALLLQYGHGTGTGGYVRGIDYINPALEPVFQKLAEDAWREVTK